MGSRSARLLALVAVYLLIAHVVPPPEGVDPQGWRITGIFFATIAGLMLQPLPGSQVVLIGITALVLVGRVPMARALEGYSAASVWMVLAAMMMSRALRDCGLARRIALLFVRGIGSTSLGLGYALHLTDLTLATGVPSITARSASIVFPIARSISSLYESEPGPT
ncbi:MAG: anion permease, partial [Acidobacteria bacterium]|nr:anion permease [Acidobacteriota bacterium]